MGGYFLIAAIIIFILVVKHKNKLENSYEFKNATEDEQKMMLEQRDLESKKKMVAATKEYYYGDSKSAISKSSTTSSDVTYNNPTSGLPMTNGIGGVDAGGSSYGM